MRRKIRDIRRDELIEATIAAIHQNGFAALTIGQIAETANASVGSISYYFGGKEQLLEEAMRRLLSILHECAVGGLKAATGPRARLNAIVVANFDDRLFSAEKCAVWMQFWAYAPYAPPLARLQRINRSRVSSNVRAELKALFPGSEISPMQRALQAYMDGVWLEAAQSEQPIDTERAQRSATQFLGALLAAGPPAST